MLTLILIGLVGGLVTGISPCILPVLPVIFLAGGTTKNREDVVAPPEEGTVGGTAGGVAVAERTGLRGRLARPRNLRPYAVIAGLVVSFSFFTLAGSLLIGLLGLPADILKIAGVTVLIVIGLSLIFPKLEEILEKPFSRIPQRSPNQEGGAFGLGLGLGLLYVPCAGPVLAAITVASATGRIGLDTVALTLSFAVGASLPLLIFALAGRRVAERVRAFRTRARLVRGIAGAVMILLAFALTFNLQQVIQRAIPDYTAGLQEEIAGNEAFRPQLSGLYADRYPELDNCSAAAPELASCGPAPEFDNIAQWFNTPTPEGLTTADLQGKVTLVDFWTYSCINCQRSVPHVVAWDAAYRDAGLQVIGIHSPEFAFERDADNVREGMEGLGITYPVAMDNDKSMFNNYRTQYWPASFLIDATGTVRYFNLGEGDYDITEGHIRELLRTANPAVALPDPTDVQDRTVTDERTTRETYLNHSQLRRYEGAPLQLDTRNDYSPAADLPKDSFTLGGTWTTSYKEFTAGPGARIDLHYSARNVYVVLGGEGSATVDIEGVGTRTFPVSGTPRIYPLIEEGELRDTTLHLDLSDGLEAYVFTFG